ncbi:MAG: hypothetical protein SGI90_10655 [Candidatus Eisenbacteria bacterium]|nr:hypothetical protein [Candidatus Eisenbacteria bacterium]
MNDDFLGGLRGRPTTEFKSQLRERLRRQEQEEGVDESMTYDVLPARAGWRPWPLFAGGVLAAAVLALVLSPALRASANAFLDLFRVRTFAVVSIDPARLERLQNGSIDLEGLLAGHTETLQEPGPPRTFTDVASAGSAAGFAIRVPGLLPAGLTADTVTVRDSGEARFTAQTAKLREVLDALGLTDVTIPAGLDGAQVGVRTSPSVTLQYRSERRRVSFLQARSPEVSLPPGIDLAEVGEIGLRIAGLDRGEAARFARSIDWHSTLLVPLPTDAGSFREVNVRGNKALLITTNGEAGPGGGTRRSGAMLMWAEGDMVYALKGNLESESLVEMAASLQ